MSDDRLTKIASRLLAARRQGTRIALAGADRPADFEEGFAIQERVVAELDSPVIGWKVMEVAGGPVIFAPLLEQGLVAAGSTWTVTGGEPAGIELEIAFRMARDVPAGVSGDELRDATGSAHVVFELCQSRIADPAAAPRHVMLADCIANAGLVVGPAIAPWSEPGLKGRAGRLLVDGALHAEGKSADPFAALKLLPAALERRGKSLRAGQIVITGSLIGMNWLKGRHALKGVIDGCGELAIALAA
jgi:2-keto-4-pentenoate hydratase